MKIKLTSMVIFSIILLAGQFYLFPQQIRDINQKVFTKSEDILNANIAAHYPENESEPEKTIVITKILDNGYILESRLGQFWNGTDWDNSSLSLYTYTPEGLITEEINQFWNNGAWENTSRFLTTYYLNSLISTYVQQTWNGTDWDNSYLYESLYNTNNQLNEYNVYQWNGTMWDNMYKTIYTYYTSGNLETIVDQQWDGSGWLNSYKYSFQYNPNNNVSEKLTEEWSGGSWKNSIIDVYSYNPQNQVELIASYWWSETFWKESVEIYYEYDGMGNVIDKLTKFWESEILGLQNKYHATYEYLPATNLETKVENQEWDLQLTQWINTFRDVKIYNEDNVLQNYLMDVWDGSAWLSMNQENYSYDENGNLDTLLAQYWSGTEWINTYRAFHIWSPVTDIETENLVSVLYSYSLEQNYPNPFNPETKISFSIPQSAMVDLRVHNILGQELSILINEEKPAGTHSVGFNAANLPSGVYLYSIKVKGNDNSSFSAVKKMILIK